MLQTVVVLTYPAHFLHTARTISSIRQWHPETQEYIVVIDDLSNLAWPKYVKHARDFYESIGCRIVCASKLPFVRRHWNPWNRQQTIKLYLDELVEKEHWFFSDGDCELINAWDTDVRIIRRVPPGHLSRSFHRYVEFMLKIKDWSGFRDPQGYAVTTSAIPMRHMRTENLKSLRKFIQQVHGWPIHKIHERLQQNFKMILSEWELIDCFDIMIDGQPNNLDKRPWCKVYYDFDRAHPIDYWLNQGIKISKSVWDQLPLARYK